MDDQKDIIDFLSSPDAYAGRDGTGDGTVERCETHISIVFLVGDSAFKLKRAVRYPYLDFSTLDQRRLVCEHEVEINSRTAPDIYQGVIPVTREASGDLSLDGEGAPVEWLVAMRRFDGSLLWDRLSRRKRLTRRDFEVLADIVAEFHVNAEICEDNDSVSALATTIDGNEQSMITHGGGLFDESEVRGLFARTRGAYASQVPRLTERAGQGCVRVCHGDLHLGNIFMGSGEDNADRPVLFDAIEFNDDFSHIDVFYDLSFLLMDVSYHESRRRATALLNRYLDRTADISGLPLLSLFFSLRAAIRAHVSATAATRHADPNVAEDLRQNAIRYFAMASASLSPVTPRLIAVGGLSGSGKSRMARVVAGAMDCMPGARVVRSDTMRKRLAGVCFDDRLPKESYTPEASLETYAACMSETREVLLSGYPVVLDAVFAKPEERAAAETLATDIGVPFQGLWLEASEDVMISRVQCRKHNASDATADVVRKQAGYDLGEITWGRVDSSGPKKQTEKAGLGLLGLEPDAE